MSTPELETIPLPTGDSGTRKREPEAGAHVGRYVVLEEVGAGGMGAVYRAYDPSLQRVVALKLLKSEGTGTSGGSDGHDRLLREAQAMARLAHPNVVPVYDVGTIDGEVFIAMEFVDGQTLKRWLGSPRPWRDVLAAFVAAGRGLAEAHDAGLVHRDFKPGNVMIGKDGQVRVMDFGLARAVERDDGDQPPARISVSGGGMASALTIPGAVLGTPSYMAPEQHLGEKPDAHADQYSFCVALFEGLYGKLPFEATDYEDLVRAKVKRRFAELDKASRVPSWVHRALLRGLEAQPGERWPTLASLLDRLEHDPGATRRKWLARGVGVAAVGLAFAYVQVDQGAVCGGAETQLAGVWDGDRRAAVVAGLLATDVPYAQDAAREVSDILDQYSASWVAQHNDACEATHSRGEQSSELLDLRMACLREHLAELSALTEILTNPDAQTMPKAVGAARDLSDLSQCADGDRLEAGVPPPDNEAMRAEVERLRGELARARVMRLAGHYAEGVELVTGVLAAAEATGYAPLESETLVGLGLVLDRAGSYADAERRFTDAYFKARACGDDRSALRASTGLVWVLGYEQARPDDGLQWAPHARAELRRAGGPSDEAQLEGSLGMLYARRGDYEKALAHFNRGMEVRTSVTEPGDWRLLNPITNLGNTYYHLGDFRTAEQLQLRALALGERSLGTEHPSVATTLSTLGATYTGQGRSYDALAVFRRAASLLERSVGPDHPDLGTAVANVASIMLQVGDDGARDELFRALGIWERALGPTHANVGGLLLNIGESYAYEKNFDESLRYHLRGLAISERISGPDHPQVAQARNALGHSLRGLDRYEEALEQYEMAQATWTQALGPDHPFLAVIVGNVGATLYELKRYREAAELLDPVLAAAEQRDVQLDTIAQLRFSLAQAMWAAGIDRPRALEHAQRARKEFLDAEADTKEHVANLDSWLAARGAG